MFEAFHLPVKFFHLHMGEPEEAFHRQTVAERWGFLSLDRRRKRLTSG